jgi:hypothetical protein
MIAVYGVRRGNAVVDRESRVQPHSSSLPEHDGVTHQGDSLKTKKEVEIKNLHRPQIYVKKIGQTIEATISGKDI